MCIEYFNRFTQCHCRISACIEPCSDHLEQRTIALSLNLEAPSAKSCDRYCSREIAGRQIGCCEQSPQGCPVIADAFETALENLEIEEMFDYTSEYLRITVPVWLLRELPFLVDMLWGREGVVGVLLRDLVDDSRSRSERVLEIPSDLEGDADDEDAETEGESFGQGIHDCDENEDDEEGRSGGDLSGNDYNLDDR